MCETVYSGHQRYYISVDKTTLELSGIDSSRFKPHSIRSASASAAAVAKVLVDTILRTAGWSAHCSFAKYYKKPIQQCNKENWQEFCWTLHGKCNLFVPLYQWDLSQWRINVLLRDILQLDICYIFTLINTGSKLLMRSLHWMMTK